MKNNIIGILKKINAIITDSHIVYTSGKHGSVYINKDALYPHVLKTAIVGRMFANKFKDMDIDVVAAPAVGGTILSQWVAYYLSKLKKKEIMATYTEKDKGTTASALESQQLFRRGYDKYVVGKKILVIEDLTTTGMSVKKLIDVIKKTGGQVVAVGVMVNRNPNQVNSHMMGAPFFALGELTADAFDAKDCPLCKKGVPINTKVGHGKKFLEKKE